jgi:hypothetical protein
MSQGGLRDHDPINSVGGAVAAAEDVRERAVALHDKASSPEAQEIVHLIYDVANATAAMGNMFKNGLKD